jgi:hypothetical protein
MISMLTGMTIVLYLLFAISEYASSRYGDAAVLLTAPLVAFGVMRYVQITKVFQRADDPTELLFKDWPIGIAILLFVGVFAFIIYVRGAHDFLPDLSASCASVDRSRC